MGIAHRSILVKYAQKSKVEPQHKALVGNAQTIGNWIKEQRERKNLTCGHVALKMGIAQALVIAWETNASQPDSQQWSGLAKAFGLEAHALAQNVFNPPFQLA